MNKTYKLIQELYKDENWRIGLTYSSLHRRGCLSVWKKSKNKYAHRRGIFINNIINNEYVYFITSELNLKIKKNQYNEAKHSQSRKSIEGVREELQCEIITQNHLDALNAYYLMENMGRGDAI